MQQRFCGGYWKPGKPRSWIWFGGSVHLQTLWTSGLHRKNSRGCTVIVGQWTTLVGHIMYIQSKSTALLILVLNEITLGRRACMQHGRGVVITAPPTVRYSEQILYAAILRRASHCVRYPELGGCPLFGCFICIVCMENAVGACNSVRYSVDVRYWECPLIESPL